MQMQNSQNTFEIRKQSFICAFSICMTVLLKEAKIIKWVEKVAAEVKSVIQRPL